VAGREGPVTLDVSRDSYHIPLGWTGDGTKGNDIAILDLPEDRPV